MLRKVLCMILMCCSQFTLAQDTQVVPVPNPFARDWVMHIYIGERVFHDELRVKQDAFGDVTGTLTVPGIFTESIYDFQMTGANFSFKITIDEGRGPQELVYSGILHPSHQSFIGFASMVLGGALVGGFVGQPASLQELKP